MAIYGETRTVWLFVMFDVPVDSAQQRHAYTIFRKFLLSDGFAMMQYSIYARHCPSEENMKVHKKRVCCVVPPRGEVRLLTITDAQFGKMDLFLGKIPHKETIATPQQITLL